MNKALIPALVLFCGISANAETIHTNGSAQYLAATSAISSMSTLSIEDDRDTYLLFASYPAELPGTEDALDIWDEYDIHTVFFGSEQEMNDAYELLCENGISVCYSEKMQIESANIPHTAYFPHLSYGAQKIASDKFIQRLNKQYGSSDKMPQINVAVIDTGIDYTHEFLSDRVLTDLGLDVYDNDSETMDKHSHGTHVSGIIADNTPNNVKLIPIKATNDKGELTTLHLMRALAAARDLKPDIINLSLCSSEVDTNQSQYSVFNKIFAELRNMGIVVCVSAGNMRSNAAYYFPAYMNDVIVTANHDINLNINSSSNYGSVIDIAAPGSMIYSSVPNNSYASKTGTSMATPFVSAAAALLKIKDSSLAPAQIEALIKENAVPYKSSSLYYGNGALNLTALLPSIPESIIRGYSYNDGHMQLQLDNSSKALSGGAVAIIAAESDGRLSKLNTYSIAPTVGEEIYLDVFIGSIADEDTIKIFVWDTLASQHALSPIVNTETEKIPKGEN